MPNSIYHFEIPADDVDRAKDFYERTFGWTITQYPMPPGQEYYGVTTKEQGQDGINGGLMKRAQAGQPFTNYITVDSIDDMLPVVQGNGGSVCMPKQEIGMEMGWIAAFLDPESNLIGLHQLSPQAAAQMAAAAAAKQSPAKNATAHRSPAKKKTARKAVAKSGRKAPAKSARKAPAKSARKTPAKAAKKSAKKSSKKSSKRPAKRGAKRR